LSIGPVVLEVDAPDETIDRPVALAVKTDFTVKWSTVPPPTCSTSLVMVSTDVPGTTPHHIPGWGGSTWLGAAELTVGATSATAEATAIPAMRHLNWNMFLLPWP
jgi:hypothetical protein